MKHLRLVYGHSLRTGPIACGTVAMRADATEKNRRDAEFDLLRASTPHVPSATCGNCLVSFDLLLQCGLVEVVALHNAKAARVDHRAFPTYFDFKSIFGIDAGSYDLWRGEIITSTPLTFERLNRALGMRYDAPIEIA